MKKVKKVLRSMMLTGVFTFCAVSGMTACGEGTDQAASEGIVASEAVGDQSTSETAVTALDPTVIVAEPVALDMSWTWAENSAIHSGSASLYRAPKGDGLAPRKDFTVCVNAGHGTSGGTSAQTLSHPDGTPKVTGGTNTEGAVYSIAVSTGMTFLDGTTEASVNLMVAMSLKEKLLADRYDVLMIRESDDVQLDNIARTVIANNNADIHVAIHFDGTDSNKGCFYMAVPDIASYKAMEPVASHWEEHTQLGEALIKGLSGVGLSLFGSGSMQMDLTQTSYSTIPSIDIEIGDAASDHSQEACALYAQGLKDGIDLFVEEKKA